MDSSQPPKKSEQGLGGLIAIIVAIVLGVLVGVFYGERMWKAGGIERTLRELEEKRIAPSLAYAAAKREQAQETDDEEKAEALLKEAQRVEATIEQFEEEAAELRETAAEVERKGQTGGFAYIAWEMTGFCGDLFIQVLKLLVIPLVITTMIVGITSLGDVRKLGKVGGWTVGYYMATVFIAVLLGIFLVSIIQPGVDTGGLGGYVVQRTAAQEDSTALETLLNVFRGQVGEAGSGMFPSNLFLAASETNVLALIVFALAFGGVLTTIGEVGEPVIKFFVGANEAVMKLVRIVMWFAPVGIFGLVAFNIAKEGGGEAFGGQLYRLFWYATTVILGLGIHFVFLSLLVLLLAGYNPFKYIYGVSKAMLTAITTASSSATLPISMECVEDNLNVSNRAASFVLPLGSTINMDGTALYEAVAVMYIAQSMGIPLDAGNIVVLALTATLAAVGAAGIPEAGLVTMVIVLQAVGLPISGIGMILAIDWFLDRLRTTVNVYGDTVGAAVIDQRVVRPSEAPA